MATAKTVINTAASKIGITEWPPKSNNVIFNTHYYGREVYGDDEYPWCMSFVWDIFRESGASDLFYNGQKTASCPTLARWAQSIGQWVTSDYQPGDVIIFDFDKNDEWPYEHTGILEAVEDGFYYTIEGNTGSGDDSNGGAVMRRIRYNSQIKGAYRPNYESEEEDEDMTQEKFNELMNGYLNELAQQDASDWSKNGRDWAESNNYIYGDDKGRKMYKKFITREELVVMLERIFKNKGI